MTGNLKSETRGALLWNLLDKVATQLVSVVVSLSLAWLLSSSDFGLIGMLALFMALATALVDGGFSAALIRKKTLSPADYATAFYSNLAFSVALYLLLFFTAPLIASFFEEPQLVPLVRVLFTVQLFNALSLVQSVQLTREIRFGRLTLVNSAGLVVSGAVAVGLAWAGAGVWALVAQVVSLGAVKCGLLWGLGGWRPAARFSRASFDDLFAFGGRLTFSAILNVLSVHVYSLLLGRLFSKGALGFYTQAVRWSDMAVVSIYGSIQSATYPIFSSIQEERDRLIRAYRKTIRFTAFVTFPALLGLALVSRPFVLGCLTEKWADAIPFLQLLSVAGIFTVLIGVNGNFVKVAGDGKWILRLEWFRVACTALVLLCTWRESMLVIVAGMAGVRLLCYLSVSWVVSRIAGYRLRWQLQDIFPYAALSGVTVGIGYLLSFVVSRPLWLLVAQIVFCAAFYAGANWYLDSKLFREIVDSFRFKKREEPA